MDETELLKKMSKAELEAFLEVMKKRWELESIRKMNAERRLEDINRKMEQARAIDQEYEALEKTIELHADQMGSAVRAFPSKRGRSIRKSRIKLLIEKNKQDKPTPIECIMCQKLVNTRKIDEELSRELMETTARLLGLF